MRPVVINLSDASVASKASNPVILDHYISPFATTLSVLVDGTVDYTVQYTFDQVFENGWTGSVGNWVNHPSLSAKTATLDSNLAYPATAVRIVLNSGSGSVRFTVIQAGIA
jgi:hypothetical protein